MALPASIARLAMSVVGPEVLKLLKKAAADPRTREQANAIIGQIRSGVTESTPAGRARLKLLRDLDATVALARGRVAGARDDAERALAASWLHDAQDIRHAADIAGALGKGGHREMVEELQNRRQALLLRMLEATVPDSAPFVEVLFRQAPAEPDEAGPAVWEVAAPVAASTAGDRAAVVDVTSAESEGAVDADFEGELAASNPELASVDPVVGSATTARGGDQRPSVEDGRP